MRVKMLDPAIRHTKDIVEFIESNFGMPGLIVTLVLLLSLSIGFCIILLKANSKSDDDK